MNKMSPYEKTSASRAFQSVGHCSLDGIFWVHYDGTLSSVSRSSSQLSRQLVRLTWRSAYAYLIYENQFDMHQFFKNVMIERAFMQARARGGETITACSKSNNSKHPSSRTLKEIYIAGYERFPT